MRPIKFRAWDKRSKIMCDVDELHMGSNGKWYVYLNRQPLAEIELMQFTGLKDINGKDVFEGDVIMSSRTWLNYVIQWDKEGAEFRGVCTDQEKDFYLGAYAWGENEVIGNIYENPELLGVKDD